MFGFNRLSPFGDFFNFQREMDQLFDRFWNQLPARTAGAAGSEFRVNTNDDGWNIEVPLPGIDPKHVALEAAGNTLSIRVEEPGDKKQNRVSRYEQTLTVPQFLDLDRVTATHRHGLLRLTLPLKESVKPRRIEIQAATDNPKQLAGAAA